MRFLNFQLILLKFSYFDLSIPYEILRILLTISYLIILSLITCFKFLFIAHKLPLITWGTLHTDRFVKNVTPQAAEVCNLFYSWIWNDYFQTDWIYFPLKSINFVAINYLHTIPHTYIFSIFFFTLITAFLSVFSGFYMRIRRN
jgi:hypothetical protein